MKKIFLILVSALIVVSGVVYYRYSDSLKNIHASYSDSITTINASFNNTKQTVTFSQNDIGTVTLSRAMSGSGIRYANSDESLVFWEHQEELTITKDGKILFQGKVQSR